MDRVDQRDPRLVRNSLESLNSAANNLPVQLTSFVGRQKEIDFAKRLLDRSRLLTVTGAGGCGKTRLALQLAADRLHTFPGGVWWVDLAPLNDPQLVANAVAAALAVHEVALQPFEQRLVDVLQGQAALLLIDNCEHLVEACAHLVGTLLQGCPSLTVIATSREPLGLEGETPWRVPSLTIPDDGAKVTSESFNQSDAVRLFIERATSARPNFHVTADNAGAIGDVCRRLDGIPLAIELAAARTRILSPEQIASGLDDRFRLLTGGSRTALARQQTLLASVEWSYGLLTKDERASLRRLSVFAGTFTLDGAEALCADDTLPQEKILDCLAGLVDKSLVQVEEQWTPARYRLLETIRQYAGQKLMDTDEAHLVRDRHVDFFVELAGLAQRSLEEGPNSPVMLDALDLDYDDLRAAMEWARASAPEKGMRIARGLWIFWSSRGLWTEGGRLSELAAAAKEGDPRWRSRALSVAAALATNGMQGARASALGEEAARLARSAEDRATSVEALYVKAASLFFTQPHLARPLLEEAIGLLEESQAGFWHMRSIYALGVVATASGDLRTAEQALAEALQMHRQAQNRLTSFWVLYWGSFAASFAGNLDYSDALAAEAVATTWELHNHPIESASHLVMSVTALFRGDVAGARVHWDSAGTIVRAHPDPLMQAVIPYNEALLRLASRDLEDPLPKLNESVAFFDAGAIKWIAALVLAAHSGIMRVKGDLLEAARLAHEAVVRARDSRNILSLGTALRAAALVARAEGEVDTAEEMHYQSLRLEADAGAKPYVVNALESVAGMASLAESWEEAGRLLAAADLARHLNGFHRYESEVPDHADDLRRVKVALGSRFDEIWSEGASMSLDEAVAYATRGRGGRKRPSSGWKSLTPTEMDVVRLAVEGLTNAQIGAQLFMAPGTVKNHLSHVFAKTGVTTRTGLAAEVARRRPDD